MSKIITKNIKLFSIIILWGCTDNITLSEESEFEFSSTYFSYNPYSNELFLYAEIDIVEMIIGADNECAPRIAELLNDTRKFWPKCESEMVIRTAKKGKNAGKHFWGCRGYPNCRTVFQIDTETTPTATEATQPQYAEPTDESLARIKELLKLIMESP